MVLVITKEIFEANKHYSIVVEHRAQKRPGFNAQTGRRIVSLSKTC